MFLAQKNKKPEKQKHKRICKNFAEKEYVLGRIKNLPGSKISQIWAQVYKNTQKILSISIKEELGKTGLIPFDVRCEKL